MPAKTRKPLSRDRVLTAAMALADDGGLESLSMRRLAKEVGVEAMSLYHHVANKEALVDGLVDMVFAEIEVAEPGKVGWREAMHDRAHAVRAALLRHPWAVGIMEGRMRPGPETIRYHEAVLGCLREGDVPLPEAIHAMSVLDAYTYGFAVQERNLPFDTPEESAQVMDAQRAQVPEMDGFPRLMEVAAHLRTTGYDYATEFAFGLELILDGLERRRAEL